MSDRRLHQLARRRRPEPERPRRRRRRLLFWQKAVLFVCVGIIGFIAFIGLRKTIKPVRLVWAERREVLRMQDELAQKEKTNRELKNRRQYLLTPSGTETEARRLGFVRPGEVSIIISEDEKDKKPDDAEDPKSKRKNRRSGNKSH